jgi:pimeloyl-ACP methyl ester carboxylesterase
MPAALTRRALLASGAALAAGCVLRAAPPLARIYGRGFGNPEPPPLVVIPGAFGSELHNPASGREIWPGSAARLLVSSYRDIALAFDEETLEPQPGSVVSRDVLRDGLLQDFYGALLRTLERAGGYRRCTPGVAPAPGRNYYVFAYDWRLDNSASACALHALIEQIRRDYGDGAQPVDVVAHSNGGLLARYYARFGAIPLRDGASPEASCAGARAIRRLLLVGTPNLGTLQPALAFARGEEMGLRSIPPEVVATCPGAPQLLPHPALPWLADVQGRSVRSDVFDANTWRELRWCVFDAEVRARTIHDHGGGAAGRRYLAGLERYFGRHLARARQFALLMAQPAPEGDAPVFLFGGDCALTPARLVVERIGDRFFPREAPDAIEGPLDDVDYAALMYEPGDLVVTRDSLLARAPHARGALRIEHAVFLCEEHRELTGNATFQDNLLHALLAEHP